MTTDRDSQAEEIEIRRLIADRIRATRDRDAAGVIACGSLKAAVDLQP